MNNFALYTSKNDFSDLEKAKKTIDEAYKTKKDSFAYRSNLIRALVYSSLAYADSTRKLKYQKDPIAEAVFSMNRLKNPKLNDEHEPEISFVKKQLAKAWLLKANRAVTALNYPEAYQAYLAVDSLSSGNYFVTYNLAILSEKLGYINKAIDYYEQLIKDKQKSQPDYFLALSNLYETVRNHSRSLEVLQEGRKAFPGNRDILFKEINIYVDSGSFSSVEELIDNALELDRNNSSLNYLAGFAYESVGKKPKAEQFYKKVVSLEQNSYEGHYSLGLLYLDLFLKSKETKEKYLPLAKKHLLEAGEINPNSVNVLKALSILYTETNNMIELEKVNNKLKQFIF
ncbi:lipopolysaccharide assembly protein LapB [Pedobacter sp. SYSU D00535]|uniref:tetratricopeptide repeat protein n=1 Tax=Pedobacter sp. SYSU D00535 TaxID=2810308 RepID=UPI001A958149|nr:tetratricopeptide repeat protein [Pedobacter sp. SYSU D00535]